MQRLGDQGNKVQYQNILIRFYDKGFLPFSFKSRKKEDIYYRFNLGYFLHQ